MQRAKNKPHHSSNGDRIYEAIKTEPNRFGAIPNSATAPSTSDHLNDSNLSLADEDKLEQILECLDAQVKQLNSNSSTDHSNRLCTTNSNCDHELELFFGNLSNAVTQTSGEHVTHRNAADKQRKQKLKLYLNEQIRGSSAEFCECHFQCDEENSAEFSQQLTDQTTGEHVVEYTPANFNWRQVSLAGGQQSASLLIDSNQKCQLKQVSELVSSRSKTTNYLGAYLREVNHKNQQVHVLADSHKQFVNSPLVEANLRPEQSLLELAQQSGQTKCACCCSQCNGEWPLDQVSDQLASAELYSSSESLHWVNAIDRVLDSSTSELVLSLDEDSSEGQSTRQSSDLISALNLEFSEGFQENLFQLDCSLTACESSVSLERAFSRNSLSHRRRKLGFADSASSSACQQRHVCEPAQLKYQVSFGESLAGERSAEQHIELSAIGEATFETTTKHNNSCSSNNNSNKNNNNIGFYSDESRDTYSATNGAEFQYCSDCDKMEVNEREAANGDDVGPSVFAADKTRGTKGSLERSSLSNGEKRNLMHECAGFGPARSSVLENSLSTNEGKATVNSTYTARQQSPGEASTKQAQSLATGGKVRAMRAAKDLAKISAPSLAALQYLPGQMDAFKLVKRKQMNESNSNTNSASETNAPTTTTTKSVMAHAEQVRQQARPPSANKDDSCLFLQRLCMCNCMAHHQSSVATNAKPAASSDEEDEREQLRPTTTKAPKYDCQQSRGVRRARSSLASVGLARAASKRTQQCGDKDVRAFASVATSDQVMAQDEKQSPSFFTLLGAKRASLRSAKGLSGAPNGAQEAQPPALSARSATDKPCERLYGGVASSRLAGGPFECTNQTIPSSPMRRRQVSDEREQLESSGSELGLASAPTSVEQQTETHKSKPKSKKSTYRKFLSPVGRKLFASASSSIDDQQQADSDLEHKQKRRSFLSNSLNRLSGRRKQKRNHNNNNHNELRCASACDSIGSVEERVTGGRYNAGGSLTSFDETTRVDSGSNLTGDSFCAISAPTRLLETPEIVLSRAQFLGDDFEDRSSQTSGSMTRSIGGRPEADHQATGCQRGYTSPPESRSQKRDSASEINFARDQPDGGQRLNGPLSLPGSPHAQRRRHERTSQSPRLSQSPVCFQSPASESTKIEDGLRVCSMEHFEKHIGNIKDSQTESQKRLFTAWINHFVPNLIRHDLIDELRDGIKLIALLAHLSGDEQLMLHYERLNRDRQSYINRLIMGPSSRLKHLSNVTIAIEFLRKNMALKLVNLNPMDIVSGNSSVILGLCWNIILNFQLQQGGQMSDESSEWSANSTSSASSPQTAGELARERQARPTGQRQTRANRTQNEQVLEFTHHELRATSKRMLRHINKRFQLKLTNLNSSLVDGDVLFAIICKLSGQLCLQNSHTAGQLRLMSEQDKLEHCFELAEKYLNVPRLISAQDLAQQGDTSNKSLLVYLSMLLKSNPRQCSTDQMLELRQLDDQLERVASQQSDSGRDTASSSQCNQEISVAPEVVRAASVENKIGEQLQALQDSHDRFHALNLQESLLKIKNIHQIFQSESEKIPKQLVERHERLMREAQQVERLIDWINEADQLFEQTSHESPVELARAIDKFRQFFAAQKLPIQIGELPNLCPILERQFRECLATARQRVLTMEQTMKNWHSYEEARKQLHQWLVTAESKLAKSLLPVVNETSESCDPLTQHLSRLDDLIEYFELEPIDYDELVQNQNEPLVGAINSSADQTSGSLSNSFDNRSISSSLISLGSTGSRLSTLTSSKKASYFNYFDEFELKCRLLAAMLEQEQKDALLVGVRELKSRLKYITEIRVPQVVNELRMSISRCEMSIQEQDEVGEQLVDTVEKIPSQLVVEADEQESDHEDEPLRPDCQQVDSRQDHLIGKQMRPESDEIEAESTRISEIVTRKSPKRAKRKNNKIKTNKTKNKNGNNKSQVSSPTSSTTSNKSPDSDRPNSLVRTIWNRITRASKLTISINIMLLICLTGICVLPLMQKDACCELSQGRIAPARFTSVYQKPV